MASEYEAISFSEHMGVLGNDVSMENTGIFISFGELQTLREVYTHFF